MAEAPAAQPSQTPTHAIRLTFAYDGDQVNLLSQQRVQMRLPPSDPVEGYAGHKGFWCELKDAQNRTLYRRVMHHPMRPDVEVFSDDPEKTISRQPVEGGKGVFTALVPDSAQAHEVVLSASPPTHAEIH